MIQSRQHGRIGRPTLAGLCVVVVAIIALSLSVTAIGTARFAVAMGYDAAIGYAIGATFDLAKGLLLVGVLGLWWRRSVGLAAIFGAGWTCLVIFSCLATHATVSTAISSIERTGTWKTETRSDTRAE